MLGVEWLSGVVTVADGDAASVDSADVLKVVEGVAESDACDFESAITCNSDDGVGVLRGLGAELILSALA